MSKDRHDTTSMKEKVQQEGFRKWFNLQFVKLKQVAMVGSLVILAVNLSLTLYPYIEHRLPYYIWEIPRAWLGIPLIFVFVMFVLWIIAHIWTSYLEMYRTQQRAERMLNPYNVYHFNPFQIAWYRNFHLPLMKEQLEQINNPDRKKKYKRQVERVERWLDIGYIPKDEYPDDIKEFYLTDKKNRL